MNSVDNMSVGNDICIPGSIAMEMNAVLQGPTGLGTMIVERVLLPRKPLVLVAPSIVDSQKSVDHLVMPIRM